MSEKILKIKLLLIYIILLNNNQKQRLVFPKKIQNIQKMFLTI